MVQGECRPNYRPVSKNGALRDLIVATGSDGYKAVISEGEIDPKFGNKSETTQFSVQGAVSTSLTMTLASLEALPAYTETVTYLAGSTSVTDTYTGALLWDVLGAAGVVTDSTIKNDILRKAVAITGSDGCEVAFSLGEIDPMFGDDPILVAYSDDLGQLGDGGADGFARIVAPGDVRWRSLRLQHRQPDSLRRNDSARAGRRRIVPGWSGRSARVSPAPGLISFTSANVAERVSDRNALSSRS